MTRDVFVSLARNQKGLRDEDPLHYLYVIAHNRWIDELRRRAAKKRIPLQLHDTDPAHLEALEAPASESPSGEGFSRIVKALKTIAKTRFRSGDRQNVTLAYAGLLKQYIDHPEEYSEFPNPREVNAWLRENGALSVESGAIHKIKSEIIKILRKSPQSHHYVNIIPLVALPENLHDFIDQSGLVAGIAESTTDSANPVTSAWQILLSLLSLLGFLSNRRSPWVKYLTSALSLILIGRCFLASKEREGLASMVKDPLTHYSSDEPYLNTLGMQFVHVPGIVPLICIHETRRKDYLPFAREIEMPMPLDAVQNGDYPVSNIGWAEAQAYCRWLTNHERMQGLLTHEESYRLPFDQEWAVMVGTSRYPWGDTWRLCVGNYGGAEFEGGRSDYIDPYAATAPVHSFSPNNYGLYHLGGNVSEWCERDVADSSSSPQLKIVRGGNYMTVNQHEFEAVYKEEVVPDHKHPKIGFRLALTKTQ